MVVDRKMPLPQDGHILITEPCEYVIFLAKGLLICSPWDGEIVLDSPGGPMESRGSLEVEEEAQEEVKGMQCKHSTFTPGLSSLDNGGRDHEPGKAEWLLEAGKRKETDSPQEPPEGMQTLPEPWLSIGPLTSRL